MATELPIACSLAPAELPQRLAEMAALGREALVERRVDGTRAHLRFAGGRETADRVRRIAAAERDCCAFLALRVEEAAGEVVLTADAPPGAEGVLTEWAGAFGPAPGATPSPRGRTPRR